MSDGVECQEGFPPVKNDICFFLKEGIKKGYCFLDGRGRHEFFFLFLKAVGAVEIAKIRNDKGKVGQFHSNLFHYFIPAETLKIKF